MTEELKPCPFCGGEAEYIFSEKPYPHRVSCKKCKIQTQGSAFRNDEFNAKEWNTRAPEPELQQLREENERLKAEHKKDCIEFFYWWHNQPGTNTEQGYDQWLEAKRRGEA